MNVSATSFALSGIAAAQMLFDGSARAASSAGGDSGAAAVGTQQASTANSVGVAVLRMALDSERSLVDILA